jgi:sulfur transfer protein SufE
MATQAFEEIADAFEFLDDWEDRYRHVIDLGKAMPPLDEDLRVPATKVQGCASQVWLVPEIDGEGRDARLSFRGDSDAMIVRGLIAILVVRMLLRPDVRRVDQEPFKVSISSQRLGHPLPVSLLRPTFESLKHGFPPNKARG